MRAPITKSVVDKIEAGSIVWDTKVVGFGARRQREAGGVHYVLKAKNRWHTIGRHGSPFTVETARAEALRLLGLIVSGEDPRPATSEDIGSTIELYLSRRKPAMKPRSYVEISRHLLAHGKPLHRHELHEVNRRAVAELLAKIEAGSGPVARNRVRASLSAFFSWCIEEGLCEANPVAGTGKADERTRERILSPKEIAKIWSALHGTYGDVVRLLLLTGQRREEIGGLMWSEVDFDSKLLRLGAARTKNKREHLLPLSAPALAILRRRATEGNGSTDNDGRVFSGFNWGKSKAKLDAALKLPHWTLHDLRRSAATLMADQLGILPHIVEAILNHVSGHKAGVAGIYNRAKYLDEMRAALDKWATWIEANAAA
jgi:integrase